MVLGLRAQEGIWRSNKETAKLNSKERDNVINHISLSIKSSVDHLEVLDTSTCTIQIVQLLAGSPNILFYRPLGLLQ